MPPASLALAKIAATFQRARLTFEMWMLIFALFDV
jgi:hypothetical protein